MSSRDSQRRINILMLGMTSVGKTSLVRLAQKKNFSPDYRPTVHNDYDVSIMIRGFPYAVTITDTEGLQLQDDNVPDPMLMNKQGIILVYSIEDEQSFEILENAMNDIANRMEIPMLLVGNKTDLPNRQVPTNDGETLAQEFAIQHHETSARNLPDGTCPEIFKMLIDTILSDGRDHTVFLDQAEMRRAERRGVVNHAQAAAQAQAQAAQPALSSATAQHPHQAQLPTTTQMNPGHHAGVSASARGSTNPQAPAATSRNTTSITSSNSHSALRDQPPTNSHSQGQRTRNHYEADQGVQNQRTQGRRDNPGSRARNENNHRGAGRQSSDRESEGTAANRGPAGENRGNGQEPPGGEYRECSIM